MADDEATAPRSVAIGRRRLCPECSRGGCVGLLGGSCERAGSGYGLRDLYTSTTYGSSSSSDLENISNCRRRPAVGTFHHHSRSRSSSSSSSSSSSIRSAHAGPPVASGRARLSKRSGTAP